MGKNSPAGSEKFPARKIGALSALFFLTLLCFCLNFLFLSDAGYGNTYYAAAVKSMTENFRNFFFVSFDPAGLVSVDKPPLGLWVQTVFVLLLGYHGWVLILPQALAAAGSCILMYLLTAKHFSRSAGLLSSLVFTLTPVVVAASRNNTMDMQLVFILLTATWFLFRSIETSRWRYLFVTAVLIGLGFNIKMLQAYMILPAVVLVYLLTAKGKFRTKFLTGLISTTILFAVSFSWITAVDLYPASLRSYVGSSSDNSEWQLVFGHNGMERLTGENGTQNGFSGDGIPGNGRPGNGCPGNGESGNGGPGNGMPPGGGFSGNGAPGNGFSAGGPDNAGPGNKITATNGSDHKAPGNRSFHGQNMASGGEIGISGPFRLWNSSLYGQVSWLLLLIPFCLLVSIKKFHPGRLTLRQGIFAYWFLWLTAMILFFSFAGFYHRYYLCMMAPAIAGLTGIGLPEMIHAFQRRNKWKQFLLPASVLVVSISQSIFVWRYPAIRRWLLPLIAIPAVIALSLMLLYLFRSRRFILHVMTGCLLFSFLAAPCYWCLTCIMYSGSQTRLPYAGPELASTSVPGFPSSRGSGSGNSTTEVSLEAYLLSHYRIGSYLVVARRSDDVADLIIHTGLPAVAYGGFLGSDRTWTLSEFKKLVHEGKITYFLASDQGGDRNSSEILNYVKQNAVLIPASSYGGNTREQSSLYLFS